MQRPQGLGCPMCVDGVEWFSRRVAPSLALRSYNVILHPDMTREYLIITFAQRFMKLIGQQIM